MGHTIDSFKIDAGWLTFTEKMNAFMPAMKRAISLEIVAPHYWGTYFLGP